MKTYFEQIKRICYLFMIFILLIQQFGCVNSKILITAELPSYYPKYIFKIHSQKTVYLLDSVAFSQNTLTGKISEEEPTQSKYVVHIYPTSDSVVKINKAMILSIPFSGIEKIKSTEAAPGKSVILVAGSIALLVLIISIVSALALELDLDMGIWRITNGNKP